jgi:hypothetical protein
MIALLTITLLAFGALGAGSMALHISGIRKTLAVSEDIALSLTLGTGLIGWLIFFPGVMGYLSPPFIASLVIVSCFGIIPFWSRFQSKNQNTPKLPFSYIEKILLGCLAISITFDLVEAYAPQADADTMAYHFGTPSLFLRYGAIEFIPRAIDGAVPLLQQMGYAAALSIGGELTANLWLALTGWTLGAMTYIVTARFTSRPWALVATLLVMTTPAIIYGAGTGQVETRAAAYVIVAAFTVYLAIKENLLGFVWIAAIATGLFFGTKYTGLLLGFACGVIFLIYSQHRIKYAAFFSVITIAVGAQWYAFNFYHSGDPIFPVLWGILDYPINFPWNNAQSARLQDWYGLKENPVTKNILWFFAYPFVATLDPIPQFESSKVGLGVTWLLLLPIAVWGAFGLGQRFFRSPAAIFISVCLIYYTIWFFFGPSQRVRHLLPIYPLLLIALVSLAHQAINQRRILLIPCAVAFLIVTLFQMGGQTIVSLKYIGYAVSKKSPAAFLRDNIVGYDVVVALNSMLDKNDRVLVINRPWLFRLQVPYFYAHPDLQNEIMLLEKDKDPVLFLSQLNNKSITHVVALPENLGNFSNDSPLQKFMRTLHANACARIIEKLGVPEWESRTLRSSPKRTQTFLIYKITPDTCTIH